MTLQEYLAQMAATQGRQNRGQTNLTTAQRAELEAIIRQQYGQVDPSRVGWEISNSDNPAIGLGSNPLQSISQLVPQYAALGIGAENVRGFDPSTGQYYAPNTETRDIQISNDSWGPGRFLTPGFTSDFGQFHDQDEGNYYRIVGNYDDAGALQGVDYRAFRPEGGWVNDNLGLVAALTLAGMGGAAALGAGTGGGAAGGATGAGAGLAEGTILGGAGAGAGAGALAAPGALDAAGYLASGAGISLPTVGPAAQAIMAAGGSGTLAGQAIMAAGGTGAGLLSQLAGGSSKVGEFLSNNPWAGALIGGGLGALAGTEDQTSTSTTRPNQEYFDAVQPQIDRLNAYASQQGPNYTGTFGSSNPHEAQMLGLLNQGTQAGTAAQNANMGQINSLLGQATTTADATTNPYATANNPYTQAMIQAANNELTRAYNNNVQPKFASGSSFGNSGLAFAEVEALNDLTKNLSNQTNSLLWQDYANAGNLSESYAQRQDALRRDANAYAMQGAGLLGNLGESYAGRQDSMFTNNANRALAGGQFLGNYGTQQQQLQQQAQQMDWNEFQRQQDEAYRRMQMGNAVFNFDAGQTLTQTAPGNVWASALGGGILGGQATGLFNGDLFGSNKK